MKEMENDDFVYTLDALYNLCPEIKEHITSVETTDEEENNGDLSCFPIICNGFKRRLLK